MNSFPEESALLGIVEAARSRYAAKMCEARAAVQE